MPEPQIRGRWAQRLHRTLASDHPDLHAHVLAAAPEDMKAIDRATPLSWIDLRHHVAVIEALIRLVGPQRTKEIYKQAAEHALQSKLLRSITMASWRLFGRAGLAHSVGPGYALVTRHMGTLTATRDSSHQFTTITIEEIPPLLRTNHALPLALSAAFGGLEAITEKTLHVKVDDSRQSQGTIVLEITMEE